MTSGDGGGFFRLERDGQVARIAVAGCADREEPRRHGGSVHWEFAALLNRLRMGDIPRYGSSFGMVPGDGGLSLVPLHMTPMQAKEYLMLAKPYRAGELATMGLINLAVPAGDFGALDAAVDDLTERLLRRPAYALAWTKRVVNRRVAEHLNLTADAAAGYELVTYLQHEMQDDAQSQTLE